MKQSGRDLFCGRLLFRIIIIIIIIIIPIMTQVPSEYRVSKTLNRDFRLQHPFKRPFPVSKRKCVMLAFAQSR
jgi:hypothetical protein